MSVKPHFRSTLICAISSLAPLLWSWNVNEIVPEPYLDEVFHIRQAQTYCNGHFFEWDPKITTPPGLYLTSYVLHLLTGRCDVPSLRALNLAVLPLICFVVYSILEEYSTHSQNLSRESVSDEAFYKRNVQRKIHTALNITLFPPLFFFSALYYTDICSALSVLLNYRLCLGTQNSGHDLLKIKVLIVLNGSFAMLCRQTNVFWAAVFPAACAVISQLQKSTSMVDMSKIEVTDLYNIVGDSWRTGRFYDRPVSSAFIEDYFKVGISLMTCIARQPFVIVNHVWPYISLVFLFCLFLIGNGGVVLGDKSNHIATIHVPQMLYIWPYIVFFSVPLILPLASDLLLSITSSLSGQDNKQRNRVSGKRNLTPRLPIIALFAVSSGLAVKYNTVIHPFTLADNRHYIFYTFRLLRRHPAIIYVAIPIYLLCGWMVIHTLDSTLNRKADRIISTSRSRNQSRQCAHSAHFKGCVSFVLTWIVVTALSVISAPLVEPRYFIIPWMIWRMSVPQAEVYSQTNIKLDRQGEGRLPSQHTSEHTALRLDYGGVLWLETLWFGMINFLTGYVFLHRGFMWPQVPGKIQRFMW